MMSTTAAYGFQNAVFDLNKSSAPCNFVANISNSIGGATIATITIYRDNLFHYTTGVKITNSNNDILIDVNGHHDPKLEFQGDLNTGIGNVIISFRDVIPFTANGIAITNDHFALFDPSSQTFAPCYIF